MDKPNNHQKISSFSSSSANSTTSGGRYRGFDMKDNCIRSSVGSGGGGGRGGGGQDKIDSLGRLLARILRHMASELSLNVRNDGYVKVQDLLKLTLKTYSDIPLRSHTVDDIKEAVRKDSKQRFRLLEENRELLIRANQGHSITLMKFQFVYTGPTRRTGNLSWSAVSSAWKECVFTSLEACQQTAK